MPAPAPAPAPPATTRAIVRTRYGSPDVLELRNITTVAELIVGCAAARHESRGLHSTIDYPGQSHDLAHATVMKRGVPPPLPGKARPPETHRPSRPDVA